MHLCISLITSERNEYISIYNVCNSAQFYFVHTRGFNSNCNFCAQRLYFRIEKYLLCTLWISNVVANIKVSFTQLENVKKLCRVAFLTQNPKKFDSQHLHFEPSICVIAHRTHYKYVIVHYTLSCRINVYITFVEYIFIIGIKLSLNMH